MRVGILAVLLFLASAAPAAAQSTLTLDATAGPPIVDAQINGRPVRLEVDLRFPRGLAMSQAAAQRLGVRRVPFLAISVGIEGSGAELRGRLARPRITFPGGAELDTESTRAFAGIFPAPVSLRADGVIGPGALPYDVITVTLGPDQPGARDIVFALEDADEWEPQTSLAGEQVTLSFDVASRASVFNRTASRRFDESGAIVSAGEVAPVPLILGLTTLMQPVQTALAVEGLALAPAYARTNAPLMGATEEDVIVVRAESEHRPSLSIGRGALERCSSIRVERRARRMTLRCAA
jgi:hypothetical protein